MTALLIIGIILASITAYLGTGTALARRDLPRSIAANTREAGSTWLIWNDAEYRRIKKTYEHDYIDRPPIKTEQAQMLWGWPIVAPLRAWRHGLESRIDRYDPAVTRALEADLERLETKIKELKS